MTHNEPSEFMFRNDARSSGANSSTAGSEKAMVQAGVNRSNHLVLIEISASNIQFEPNVHVKADFHGSGGLVCVDVSRRGNILFAI